MDKDIQRYFEKIKKEDSKLETPDYKMMVGDVAKRNPTRPILAAMIIILIIAAIWKLSHTPGLSSDSVPKLKKEPEFSSNSLLVSGTDIMDWESTTDYLLEY